ncbi:BZ3500_MvSof-1268-A1-R1_Chr3-2g06297 [Microbotryum saponariae]|uniref:BZ3500_MvSof-1268-A1-R1_Chr3-2g06297 protein n=1 Tax=Microbotryum saponariae TaxID=289078 RepID=A0A2X0L1W6_9BASI|nr:BZ3500_MvSof-1268-A1-R1_Chr3-2g06297 [Microbotryum saponariae]SDA04268.1 BZ3501_MvSof-1269-A2-R1_Chr3-2g05988 [Microbotryum saponariae]
MSSASLKSLMAAKKASSTQRITHPFASYDRQSRLTCTLCPATVLKHDNLWGAHLISKGHRVNVQRYEREQQALREREEAAAVAAAAAAVKGKRKRSRSAEPVHGESNNNEKGKRAREAKGTQQSDDDEDGPADENRTSALPDDFFTDRSQVPTRSTSAQDDATDPTPATAEEDDPEWAAFEASLQQDAPQPTTTTTTSSTAKATIFAAPVAYEFGAPKVAEEGEEQGEPEEEEEEETEEERLERLEREQVSSYKKEKKKWGLRATAKLIDICGR